MTWPSWRNKGLLFISATSGITLINAICGEAWSTLLCTFQITQLMNNSKLEDVFLSSSHCWCLSRHSSSWGSSDRWHTLSQCSDRFSMIFRPSCSFSLSSYGRHSLFSQSLILVVAKKERKLLHLNRNDLELSIQVLNTNSCLNGVDRSSKF